MPVIPEDIWMRILQISDEDAFRIERPPHTDTGRDWSDSHRSSFAATHLKPVSATFSMVCSHWRTIVLNSSVCWLTTINCTVIDPSQAPIDGLEYALQRCSMCDIDIYIHQLRSLEHAWQMDSSEPTVKTLFHRLVEHSSRWRSFLLLGCSDAVSNVVRGLNKMDAERLVALDIVISGPKFNEMPNISLINSRFPLLRQLHVESSLISLGPLADLPIISHLAMTTCNITAQDLLRAMSNSPFIKKLMIGRYMYEKRHVVSGPIPAGLQLSLPYLTDLKLHITAFDTLSLFLCIKLPRLTTLHVRTGDTESDDSDLVPSLVKNQIILPSLLSFVIDGSMPLWKHLTVISHISMPHLTNLRVWQESGVHVWDLKGTPPITLPSLQTMVFEDVAAPGDLGIFDAPVLGTLKINVLPHFELEETFRSIPSRSSMPFPLLHTLVLRGCSLMDVDRFLCHHSLPSLLTLGLYAHQDEDAVELEIWEEVFERQRGVLAQLEEFHVEWPSKVNFQELLSKHFPCLASPAVIRTGDLLESWIPHLFHDILCD